MLCIYIALFQLSYKKSKSIENDLFKMKDVDAAKIHSVYSSPQPFWHQGLVSWKTVFPQTGGGEDGFGMIQGHYIYCALYFCYYYISSPSDHQALDPRDWGPLVKDKPTVESFDLLFMLFVKYFLCAKYCDAAAAAAKSLQSCPTLCDPIDGSPPGSCVPGILQARTLEWVCHFLLQCRKVKSQSEVAQSCLTLRDPIDCSLPGSSIHGIFQARVLEWGAIAFSKVL